MFNVSQFWEKANNGELATDLARPERHADPERSGEPFCTMSQTINYFTLTGERVARIHQYQRPDGSIGGSGKPDPKWLILRGWVFGVRSTKHVSLIRRLLWAFQDNSLALFLRVVRLKGPLDSTLED